MENKLYYRLEKILKFTLNFLTTLLLVLLFVTSLKPFVKVFDFLTAERLQIYSLVLQIVSILFSVAYDFIVKYNIFHAMLVYNMIGYIKDRTIIQRLRSELRNSLNIITGVVIFCTLYEYLVTKNLLVFITILLVIFIAYMYADYFPYTILCGKFYDSKFLKKNEKSKMSRGLARIYLDEYKKTKFDRNDPFYKEYFKDLTYEKDNKYQDECIKEILHNWADFLTAPDIILNLIMFIINFIMLIASSQLEDIIRIYIPNGLTSDMRELILIIFLIVINIIFSYISYKGVNTCRKGNEKTKRICDIIKSNDKKERFDFFKSEYQNISKTVLSRGTYEFNISYTTDDLAYDELNNIKFPYRTLFVDRYYSHKQRFDSTAVILILILLSVLITFTVPFIYIVISISIGIVIALVLRRYFLPNIGMRRVSRECEKLLLEEKK